jgi:hypothetical protein
MPSHRLLTCVVLVSSLGLAACANSGGESSALAPTAVPSGAVTAPLQVQVDSVCSGQESEIRVFVDREPIGVTNPGEPGVSRIVSVGEHQLSAISQRGTQWGPFPTTVGAAGRVERLGCMPAAAL